MSNMTRPSQAQPLTAKAPDDPVEDAAGGVPRCCGSWPLELAYVVILPPRARAYL